MYSPPGVPGPTWPNRSFISLVSMRNPTSQLVGTCANLFHVPKMRIAGVTSDARHGISPLVVVLEGLHALAHANVLHRVKEGNDRDFAGHLVSNGLLYLEPIAVQE